MKAVAKKPAAPGLDESSVLVALMERFKAPEWAFLPQVRNATGFPRQVRTVDAIAMSLWPHRGIELHGFEIKSNRGDWLREQKHPEKSEEIGKFCDRFWLAIGQEGVATLEEMPPKWGLLVPRGKKMIIVKQADLLEATPITKKFLAAILRKEYEAMLNKAEIEKIVSARVERAVNGEREIHGNEKNKLSDRIASLERTIQEFEKKSGLRINDWNAGAIGEAVRFVQNGGLGQHEESLRHLLAQAESITERIRHVLQKTPVQEVKAA